MKNNRLFFESAEWGKSMQMVASVGGATIEVSCEDEWCGDTESGIGAIVHYALTRKEATLLRNFIDKWLEVPFDETLPI